MARTTRPTAGRRASDDNKTLSTLAPLISDAEWEKLDATGFQRLVHDYLRARFGDDVEIKPGREKGPDGGRDFELIFHHSHRAYKGYVECKHHRRPIGIETLGKYVVVVVMNHAKELHVISSSPITAPARAQLVQVMGGMNIDVALIDGIHLERELSQLDLGKYFPGVARRRVTAKPADALSLEVQVRANPDFDEERAEKATEFQSYKDQLYIHILLKNTGGAAVRLRELSVKSEALVIARDPIYGFPPDEMFPLQDASVIYGCRLIAARDEIDDGEVQVRFWFAGNVYTRRVPLPKLDFRSLGEPPLVGEALKHFLGDAVPRICRDVTQHHPRLIDIRGVSGVGKTRLLDELNARFREGGVATLRYDAMRAGDTVFRRLLAGLASVPLFEGRLAQTKEDLDGILVERGCAPEYSGNLTRFLLDEKSGWESRYAVVEALKHFLRKPTIAAPTAVIIDNVQELSPTGLDVLLELAEFVREKSGRLCLVFATNTEAMPAVMRAPVDEFHERLNSWHDGIFRSSVRVEPLELADAKLLLYSLLNGIPPDPPRGTRESPDAVIEAFINKAGLRLLDLVMAIRFLEENNVIERRGALRWYIPSFRRFRDALETVPSGSSALIRKRLDAIREHDRRSWASVRELLQYLVAFDGRIPASFISRKERAALTLLLDRAWLRLESRDGAASYVAFHDNIHRYLDTRRTWNPSRTVARRIVRWIDAQPERVRPHATAHLFNAVTAGATVAEIVGLGEHALAVAEHEGPAVLRKVGERLETHLAASEMNRSDFRRYLPIRMRYANALLLQAAVQEGLEILDDLYGHVQAGALSDETKRNDFYHAYVNANLHCGRYDTALRILKMRERNPPAEAFALFRIFDRHGVAATAIGQEAEAARWLERALEAADGNPDWEGTAYYDLGYIHIHLTHDGSKAAAAFRRSLDAYEAMTERPGWRQIEAAQMRAFIALVDGDHDAALDHAENGVWLSNHHNLTYYAVKLLNMVGAVSVMTGDVDRGVEAFRDGMSRAAMSLNPRGFWRAVANLGAVAAFQGDYAAARDHLSTVESNLRTSITDKRALAREEPIVANHLAVLARIGEFEELELVRTYWSSPRLDAFAATLRSPVLRVPGIVRHPTGFALLPT